MKFEIIDNEEHMVCYKSKDNCPLCEIPLKDVDFSWLVFHGSAKSSCCGATYQLKSYYVDKKEVSKEKFEFVESLDDQDKIEFTIMKEWIEPLKQAMKTTGIKDIRNEEVNKLAEKLKETK